MFRAGRKCSLSSENTHNSRSKRGVRRQGCATSDPIVLAIVLELDPIVFMSSDPIVLGLDPIVLTIADPIMFQENVSDATNARPFR